MTRDETYPGGFTLSRLLGAEGEKPASPPMDEETFREFYDRTSRRLWTYLRRLSGQGQVADDLLQDTYCRFLQASFKGAGEPQTMGYLYRIATNLVLDHRRRARRETRWSAQPSRDIDPRKGAEARLEMERALDCLRPRERSLLWLAHVQGLDHAEIASQLGLRESSVRVALFRARRKLAGILRRRGLAGAHGIHEVRR
ncbi:MAG TPA: RNA polymerase sigma factor [Candidatus Polarisedimenticolia bacterium]|jgi:RNA polymerase sigma-70 factor (ECF subfamily)